MRTIDVDSRDELPNLPTSQRWLDFLGGTKRLRCFEVPREMTRAEFMRDHGASLDEALRPVYENRGIIVRQDASYALPGFFIVSYDRRQLPRIDSCDVELAARMAVVMRQVREAMSSALDIRYVHLHCEEKPDVTSNLHYWMMPVDDNTVPITRLHIKSYLAGYDFRETRPEILRANILVRECLVANGCATLDNQVSHALRKIGTVP